MMTDEGVSLTDEDRRLLANEDDEINVDKKIPASIRWIYFVLGAAILLPWNGAFLVSYGVHYLLIS